MSHFKSLGLLQVASLEILWITMKYSMCCRIMIMECKDYKIIINCHCFRCAEIGTFS